MPHQDDRIPGKNARRHRHCGDANCPSPQFRLWTGRAAPRGAMDAAVFGDVEVEDLRAL